MQVTTEAVSGVARRLNVSVPTSRINEQFEARLKRTAKTVKINGFRPEKCLCLAFVQISVLAFTKKWSMTSFVTPYLKRFNKKNQCCWHAKH